MKKKHEKGGNHEEKTGKLTYKKKKTCKRGKTIYVLSYDKMFPPKATPPPIQP